MGAEDKELKKEWDEATKPGGETTVERSNKELIGYRPKEGTTDVPDMDQPVYVERDLPEVGSIMDRPHGLKAKVVSAQVRDDKQVIGLVYV